MEIQITAIKFETVNGKKTGKSFSFKADPKFNRVSPNDIFEKVLDAFF